MMALYDNTKLDKVAQTKALESLLSAKTVDDIAKAAEVSRSTIYYWLKHDIEFKKLWDDTILAIQEEAANQVRLAAKDVAKVMVEVAQDRDHPQYKDVLKEFNRIAERNLEDVNQPGSVHIEWS